MLYRFSCCFWKCHGKEHVLEYLAGRTVTSAQSGLRLIGFGYYDESLALARNISEIGNLLWLFFIDPSHIRIWLDHSEKERIKEYSPHMVRKLILNLGSVVPNEKIFYSWLSGVATHVNPKTKPQSYTPAGRPSLGCEYQMEGFKASLKTLAWVVSSVAGPIGKMADIDKGYAERILQAAIELGNMTTNPN